MTVKCIYFKVLFTFNGRKYDLSLKILLSKFLQVFSEAFGEDKGLKYFSRLGYRYGYMDRIGYIGYMARKQNTGLSNDSCMWHISQFGLSAFLQVAYVTMEK